MDLPTPSERLVDVFPVADHRDLAVESVVCDPLCRARGVLRVGWSFSSSLSADACDVPLGDSRTGIDRAHPIGASRRRLAPARAPNPWIYLLARYSQWIAMAS